MASNPQSEQLSPKCSEAADKHVGGAGKNPSTVTGKVKSKPKKEKDIFAENPHSSPQQHDSGDWLTKTRSADQTISTSNVHFEGDKRPPVDPSKFETDVKEKLERRQLKGVEVDDAGDEYETLSTVVRTTTTTTYNKKPPMKK